MIFLFGLIFLSTVAAISFDSSISFAAVDNALPIEIFDELELECLSVYDYAINQANSFMHGKRQTFWLEINSSTVPRTNIERAILYLKTILMKDTLDLIGGAEYWVQLRTSNEGIGFHYDKDEAKASIHGKMVHPQISTILYLTDAGSPTFIFNMTTDGNNDTPEIPTNGWISFPKINRYVMFKGTLQHGVLPLASNTKSVSLSKSSNRLTLLINWLVVFILFNIKRSRF